MRGHLASTRSFEGWGSQTAALPFSMFLRTTFEVSSPFPRSAVLQFQVFLRSFFDILDPQGNPKIARKRAVFDPKSTPQTVPNGLHMASWAPEASKSDFDRLRTLTRTPLGAPSWPQVGPKSAPCRPEDASRGVKAAAKEPLAPKTPRRSNFGPRWGPSWTPLEAENQAPV